MGNPSKTVLQYLLIEGMTCHGHEDGFAMVSTLICMVTHWTWPTKNYDIGY